MGYKQIKLYNLVFHARNMLNQIRLAARSDIRPVAPAVRVPTLLAWGRHDHTMPLRCAQLLQRLIPGVTLHVSATGSHDWIVDEPGAFADAVLRFVGGDAPQP